MPLPQLHSQIRWLQQFYCNKYSRLSDLLTRYLDSGWLETFDHYYEDKVKAILTKAVHYLTQEPNLRFIWSEISFLEKWWQNASEPQKADLLKCVRRSKE